MLITPKEAALLPLLIFGFCYLNAVSCESTDGLRNQKHFSLFSVVTFQNEECASETTFTGGQVTGTCYTATECSDKDGTKSGNCAAGFGVCCTFIYKQLVSTTISENRTYLQNPLYPADETSGAGTTTVFTIAKMQDDICQLRLDFEYFSIAGPGGTGEAGVTEQDGNCNDKLTSVVSGGAVVPTLCGVMTGAHLYMDMGMVSSDTAVLSLILASTTITAGTTGITVANAFRRYRIKTSQIPCWATYRAPDGCNQYFMSAVGQIVSPNFGKVPAGTSQGNNQLNSGIDLMNINVKYCIRREKGSCCMLYQVCNSYAGITLTTIIAGGTAANGEAGLISESWSFHTWLKQAGTEAIIAAAGNDVGLTDGACSTDYVEIPDSQTGFKSYGSAHGTNTRYCGHRFGAAPSITAIAGNNNHSPVWDCTEPFEVSYFTDQFNDNGEQGAEQTPPNGLVNLRGMCLDFSQEYC